MKRILYIDKPSECKHRVFRLKKRKVKNTVRFEWFYVCELCDGNEYCDNAYIFPSHCRLKKCGDTNNRP